MGFLKKEPGATAIGLTFGDQHALTMTNLANGMVDVERRGILSALQLLGKVLREIGISQVGLGSTWKTECDLRDDVAAALSRIEDAAAIPEGTVGFCKIDEVQGFEIEGTDTLDSRRHLLPIGPDVLYGAAADEAGGFRPNIRRR